MSKKTRNIAYYLIFSVLNLLFIFQLLKLNTLPILYNIIIGIVTFVLMSLVFYFQLISNKSVLNNISKVLLVISSFILIVANTYLYRTGSFLDTISDGDTKNETISIVVRKDSPYESLSDVKDLDFAKEDGKEEIVFEAVLDFEESLGQRIKTHEHLDYSVMAKALLDNEVEVIILNEAYRNIIEDDIETFTEDTKVIYQFHKQTQLKYSDVKVDEEPFTLFISGIDIAGSISNNSRSDVNILATINPLKKEILLLSIPRDYYLPIGCETGELEKLSHTGLYGVDCTMNTINKAFGIDIDFYVRLNFSSMIKIVDSVGGINVHVDEEFRSGKYNFYPGPDYLDGEKALAFVRHRQTLEQGLFGRGLNQLKVVTALIDRVTSPDIITNYGPLLNSLEGSVQTSMGIRDITSLVKLQLNDMSGWNIEEMQVTGLYAEDFTYSMQKVVAVMYPDYETIDTAKASIKELME